MKNFLYLGLVWFVCSLAAGTVAAEELSNSALNERIKKLEEKLGSDEKGSGWTDRITIGGVLEAEAGFASVDFDDPAVEDTDESDIVLATVELGIDADIHKHVSGHILFLWEEDDTDPVDMDEGYIQLDGKDVLPLYLKAGKFYVPFGQFESHMITDPVTLDLGETNQSAVQVGFANDWIDASIAVFNGDVDESDEDDVIGAFAAGLVFGLPEGTVADIGLSAGVSYISNIADSDTLEGFIATPDGTIDSNVAGLGAFVSLAYKETVFLEVEYIKAMDEFDAGELTFDGGEELEPSALNIELAVAPMEDLEIAVRYAKTDDFKGGVDDEVLPETQYGICAAYGIFGSTTLALEYLQNEFDNDDTASVITAQLAVEF